MTATRWAAATDPGRARERNEDAYFAGSRIFAVADGLGGHRAGEVASRLAVEELARLDAGSEPDEPGQALAEAIRAANRAVAERARRDPETNGMATTVTAVAIDGDVAHLGHVGDSRCYLLRGEQMTLVSRDHTLVARLVDEGAITLEQAETHPQRSVVTRALGSEPDVDVDLDQIDLAPGDRFLLCSDGLSSVVPEAEIAGLLASIRDGNDACAALIDAANRLGGPDNITMVIVDIAAGEELPPRRATGAAVPAAPPRAAAARPERARKPRGRAVAWATLVVVMLGGGYAGLRIWADQNWFVGLSEDRVAIYRGLPTDFVVPLHRVNEHTSLTTSDVAPFYVPRLQEGVRADSLARAREIVARIPRASPTPAPNPSPPFTPGGSGSPSGSPS